MVFYTCSICWSILQYKELIYRTNCSHLFHQGCLQKWWNSSSECPTCRSECSVHNVHPSYYSTSIETLDLAIDDEKLRIIDTTIQRQDDNSTQQIALLRKLLEDREKELKAEKERSERMMQLLKSKLPLAMKDKSNEYKGFGNGSRSSFKGRFCFSFTTRINVEYLLPELKQQILALNGRICKHSSENDSSCTHLITSEPRQSEKTLSIIATGRWLLCTAYITDSFIAGYFLNEENYEWGNSKAESNCPTSIDDASKKIAMANYKWRQQLQLGLKQDNKPVGIFTGFRAIVNARDNSLTRVLEAGLGVVIDIKTEHWKNNNFQGVTMCFVDKKKMTPADRKNVENAGIVCVDVTYLQDIFMNGYLPAVDKYIIPDAKLNGTA